MSASYRRLSLAVAASVASLGLSACGGGEEVLACSGDEVVVGSGWIKPIGTGRSQSDSYYVSTLLFDTSDGERLVMENFTGASHSLPPGSMNGQLAWSGHMITLARDGVPAPEGSIGPCLKLDIAELPPGWEPPAVDEEPGGH